MKNAGSSERSFGRSVGFVLCALAAWLAWRGHPGRAEVLGGIGIVLVGCAIVAPHLLKWPNVVWWTIARAMGYVNSRILLTILFVLVLVPLSIVWRLTGVDPLARRRAGFPGW